MTAVGSARRDLAAVGESSERLDGQVERRCKFADPDFALGVEPG
jgi:hypothetical protein